MAELLDPRKTTILLAVVFVAAFMDGIDGSVVNVALPDIGDALGVDTATVAWVAIAYFMVLAGTLVAFARLAADGGVRRILAWGFAIFTGASLVCGLSDSLELLLAARGVQGLGAAMMAAAGPICCTEHLPREKLGFGIAVLTIGASAGFALGPALGGFIVDLASWHWIFLVNIPIGLITIPLLLYSAPKKELGPLRNVDWTGAGILFASIAAGTLALEMASYPEKIVVTAVSAAVFAIGMIGFVLFERTREKPLLNLSLFRRFDFSALFVCLMLTNMSYMGMLYLLPFLGQVYMGETASTIGAVMLISATVTAFAGMPIARWSDRKGRRPFCIATGVTIAFSFAAFGFIADSITVGIMSGLMVAMGFGWAFCGGPMGSNLVEHSGSERDMASALMNEAYYVGGTIGTALIAMMFTVFSGTGGIDIMDVPPDLFMDGFVPCTFICAAMGIAVAVLCASVRDSK